MRGREDEVRDGDRLREGQSEGREGMWFEVAAEAAGDRGEEGERGEENDRVLP